MSDVKQKNINLGSRKVYVGKWVDLSSNNCRNKDIRGDRVVLIGLILNS